MTMKTARLLLLDAESADAHHSLREEDLRARVPRGLRPLPALRLSRFGAPDVVRRGGAPQPVAWDSLGAAVMRLVEAAREQGRKAAPPTHTLVAGLAPLPVFTLAGHELSAWIGDVSLVNRRRDSTWDVLTLDASAAPSDAQPFDVVTGLPADPLPGTGLVGVALTTRGVPVDHDAMVAFCRERGQEAAGLVEIRSRAPLILDATNVRPAFAQVERALGVLHGLFPKRQGVALFVDGPAPLAFLVGRALNPNVHHNVLVANYVAPRRAYEPAFTLPWRTAAAAAAPLRQATVLFVAANPASLGRLALDEEVRDLHAKIRASQYRDALRLESRWAARPDDLLQQLNELRPAILHFSGHAATDGIALQGEDGATRVVSREALVALCRSFAAHVRLVVLNACHTDRQAAAITEAVDCAIGMKTGTKDRAARVFAASFYRALGFGHSVQDAFEQGRVALQLEGIETDAAPRLRTRPGLDASNMFLVAPDAAEKR
jgi:hypothetical protein